VTRKGYVTLKKVLQLRPFDMMLDCRIDIIMLEEHFGCVNTETLELADCEIAIRVEQGKNWENNFPSISKRVNAKSKLG
jgi:hypothetical protein